MNSIAFTNLRIEAARKRLTIMKMAEGLEMNRDTLARKLSRKSPIFLDEAFRIKNEFFPELTVSFLFSEAIPSKEDGAAKNG